MEKTLVKPEETALTTKAQTTFQDYGLENWTPEDIVIPVLRIVQPTSQWDAEAGTFFDAQTGEVFKEIEAIFVKSSWGRVKFKDDISEKGIDCKSTNRIFPTVDNPPAQECSKCEYSKWGENGEPPICKETLNNIIYLIPKEAQSPLDGIPYLFSVHGMNIKPLKMALSSLITRGKPIYSRVFKLTLELTKNEKGKFYVVKYTPDKWLSPEVVNEFAKISTSYSRETIDKSLEKAEEEWTERQETQNEPEEIEPVEVIEENQEEEFRQELIQKIRKEVKEKGLVKQAKQVLKTQFNKEKLDQLTLEELGKFSAVVLNQGWDNDI